MVNDFKGTSLITSLISYAFLKVTIPEIDKKKLLKEILRKKVTLIDYENIRDNLGLRYLGFGRFAGIVGCYNTLNLYLILKKNKSFQEFLKLITMKKLKN